MQINISEVKPLCPGFSPMYLYVTSAQRATAADSSHCNEFLTMLSLNKYLCKKPQCFLVLEMKLYEMLDLGMCCVLSLF